MKKILALMLAVVMLLTMSLPAFASDADDEASAGIVEQLPDTDGATDEDDTTNEDGTTGDDEGTTEKDEEDKDNIFPESDATFIDVIIDFVAVLLRILGTIAGYIFKM